MRHRFRLVHTQARENAVRAVWEAPDGSEVLIGEPTRNLDQNAKFHAICHELQKARVLFAGRPRITDEWKQILVSAHYTATARDGEMPETVTGLEGEVIQLRESTATMTKARSSSLIQYAEAFLAMETA